MVVDLERATTSVRKQGVYPNFFELSCMGRIKPRVSKSGAKDVKKESKKLKVSPGKQDNASLKSAIQALGGDAEEDYELVKDADSDGWEDGKTVPSDVRALRYTINLTDPPCRLKLRKMSPNS